MKFRRNLACVFRKWKKEYGDLQNLLPNFAKFQISLKLPEPNEVLIIQFIFIHFFNSLVKWRLESRGGVAPDAASGHGDV